MSLSELGADLGDIALTYEDIATCWHLERDTLEYEILNRDDIIRELGHSSCMSGLDFLLGLFALGDDLLDLDCISLGDSGMHRIIWSVILSS